MLDNTESDRDNQHDDSQPTGQDTGRAAARPKKAAAAKKAAPAKKAAGEKAAGKAVAGKAPAKAPAGKAPAKRAPRKAATTQAIPSGPPVEPPPGSPEAPAAAADRVTGAVQAEPGEPAGVTPPVAPAKKAARPRKTAAKKAAPPAEPAVAGEPAAAGEPVAEPVAAPADSSAGRSAAGAPAQAGPDASPEAGQAAAPAKQVRKQPAKRATKKAAPPATETDSSSQPRTAASQPDAVNQQGTDGEPAEATASRPALAVPAVVFQPPAEVKPAPRRRRASRSKAAEAPAETVPTADEIADALAAGDLVLGTAGLGTDVEELDTEQPETDQLEADQLEAEEAEPSEGGRRRRRRGRRGRGNRSGDATAEHGPDAVEAVPLDEPDGADEDEPDHAEEVAEAALSASARRRRRRRRSTGADGEPAGSEDDPPNTVVHVRDGRGGGSSRGSAADDDGVRGVKGSTRLEAKRQRRRDNRDSGRRRAPILTEAEFLARREAVNRVMAVRQTGDRTQIAVLEDNILVEHYVTRASSSSAVGNVYLGRVQNVLPSMEAAFVDIGRGRNGVLYAGEVNWDTAGLEGKARSIENALNPGDSVLVQVTKDPIGHKGARLTSQISLPGRFVVYVPGGGMTGISRKLPDTERSRLKAILKKVVPDEAGVIVRTAAEGASEQDLVSDVERLKLEWESISRKVAKTKQSGDGPTLVHGEPDLAIRVVRDIFNDDFAKLVVSGAEMYRTLTEYVADIAPELAGRVSAHTAETDLFRDLRVDEQLAKALDRKVWLPSGGSLVIDRTEAMTVVDVNTGKYTGSGGNLEQTVTRNNLEAAEEIVRQLRLRDLGGIVVIDFIDMVLESNRELVLRRLTECLGRDRTKHQVAEVTSLGLVQMTRKRVGEGLLEAFSEPCQTCNGRGVIVHLDPVDRKSGGQSGGGEEERPARAKRTRKPKAEPAARQPDPSELAAEKDKRRQAASAVAAIAAATAHHDEGKAHHDEGKARRDEGKAQPAAGKAQPAAAASPAEPAPSAEPAATADSAADRSTADGKSANGSRPDSGQPAEAGTVSARPRRRRAASRPAGPPVPVDAGAAN